MSDATLSAGLIAPYGGRLVDLLVPASEAERRQVASLPSLRLSERSLCDLELLAIGAFSPLASFLGRADYEAVLEGMRLADGTLWPIPVTLPAPEQALGWVGSEVALRSTHDEPLAVLRVEEAWRWSLEREALAVLGGADGAHPLVAEMAGWGPAYVSGPLRVLALPRRHGFAGLRLGPRGVRERLSQLGRARVVAFQTRNPLHRSHEEMTKRAAAACDATLLLHPVVGLTRPDDVDLYTRVRSYVAVVERHYDPARTLLALVPLAMRFAGPREALWHAILRRNYGASHFIVGRDHAGPGVDSQGRPFYAPFAAQEALGRHGPEIGVTPVPFGELVYLPREDRYEEADRVVPGTPTLTVSGTEVRSRLAAGAALPEWFTRQETAQILTEASRPLPRAGFCVWLTGLPCSGKSTTAEALASLLLERGRQVTLLDGDVVRTHLSRGLGFSREDRDTNVRRIGFVAAEIVRHGGAVVCAAVSPYRATRDECRRMVGEGRFVEVLVDTPLELCVARDTKGLYARARRGETSGVTGVDDPFEPPLAPELVLRTAETSAERNASRILGHLERSGLLRGPRG